MPKKTITLQIVHLPLMLLLLALLVSSGGIAALSQNPTEESDLTQEVLSEDDDRDEDADEDEDDSDDNEDDDNDSEDDDNEEDDEDDDNGKSEQEFEREIEKNGVKMKEKVKVKTENGKTETEYEYELENEDDDEDLDEMEDTDESSDATDDISKYLKIKVHEANQNSQGASVDTRVKIMVKQGLADAGFEDSIEELELRLDERSEITQYKGVAQKSEALLGLFNISIPVDLTIDPETGEVVDQSQSLVSQLLDLFSF